MPPRKTKEAPLRWPGRWLGLCGCLLLVLGCGAPKTPNASKASDEWVRASREDLPLLVEVSGVLKARDSALLGAPPVPELWDFKIASLATEGAAVKAGQVVLEFDTSELTRKLEERQTDASSTQRRLEQRQASAALGRREDALRLAEAEAALRKAALKVDRPTDLTGAIELEEARLDQALAQREVTLLRERAAAQHRNADAELAELRDRVARAELQVKSLQADLGRMRVQAPRAGTVIYIPNPRDEKKKVGDSTWRGEKIMEIADIERLFAQGEVDEADAALVAVGQALTLRLEAHPDSEFKAQVERIASTVTRQSASNANRVVRLEIALGQGDPRRLRPGMRFRGAIERGRVRGAIVIPLRAVFPGPVAYRRDGRAAPLRLGQRGGERVEVLEGLAAGDEVRLEAAP